jgi:hypothetical protein
MRAYSITRARLHQERALPLRDNALAMPCPRFERTTRRKCLLHNALRGPRPVRPSVSGPRRPPQNPTMPLRQMSTFP